MKTMKQKFSALLLSLLVSAAAVLSAVPAYAAGASISLVANKATVANGSSLIVAVYMNGGGSPINGIEADISYPASKLQYVGVNYSGSAFEISASGGGGDGAITLDRGTTSNVSGAGLVATITFKALASSGSAAISVGGNSALVTDGNAVAFAPGGVSVNFGQVAAAAPSATSSAAAAPEPPAPPKDTTPPVITKVTVKSKTPYTAVIDWTTDEPSDSVIDYGLDGNYGLSASQAGTATAHEVSLSSSFLTPKALLHYRVKSADGSGNVQTGTDQTLQLPGVPVTVVVRADNGKPQPNADVTLDNQTATTDAKGQANLTASLGSKQVVITYNGVTVRRPITVARASKPLPPYQLDLAKQPLNHWMLTSVGLIVVVLTLLGLDLVLFGSTFVTKLIRWRWHGSPQALAAAHVTHDTGTALFSTLDQQVDSIGIASRPAPTSANVSSASPVITSHRTDLIVNDMLPATAASPQRPVTPAPVIRTDGSATAAVIANDTPGAPPVTVSAPVLVPMATKQSPQMISKQITVTETDNHPAVEVAHRLKPRTTSATAAKPSKTKKPTAVPGNKP
jgi:hypothetical protein